MRNNRIVERPWGRRLKGGWIIQRSELIDALKKGQAVEFGKLTVGADKLRKLITLLPYEDCLIRANGNLEVQTIQRVIVSRNGTRKTSFRKPRHYNQFMSIVNGAWIPRGATKVVVLRPRKY